MRHRWVLDRNTGKLVPASEYYSGKAASGIAVIKDCEPFISMADGKTIISSKSQYRDHLRQHGCVEVGNEPLRAKKPDAPSVAPILKDIYHVARDRNTDALRRIAESGKITN